MAPDLSFTVSDRPDARAEATAVAIMAEAFDPRFGEAWTNAQISSLTTLGGVHLIIAGLDGARLGFALTRHILDEMELLLLAVRPRWRGKGIGRMLVDQALAVARRDGVRTVHLEVRANNPAVSFYDILGFENVFCRPAYYKGNDGHRYDALSYRKYI